MDTPPTDRPRHPPDLPLPLLGGLSPQAFMRRHWQKKPLLVRQALPGVQPPLARAALFELAGREGVESRLIERREGGWRLRHGPLVRRALPPASRPGWTLLVQGLDLHVPAAHDMLTRFRFVPDARLDDLMTSWASDGGGVGPHLDSYDVFLIQVQGRRRWRVGRVRDDALVPDVPLKILRRFEPESEWLLEPGDMLYLPPRWGHDGVAEGECMTCSVGFRAPAQDGLAREILQRLGEAEVEAPVRLYRDPAQPATAQPGRIPDDLLDFAREGVARVLADPDALAAALGEVLTEPKASVWFEGGSADGLEAGIRLDARTKMMYLGRQIFINGEGLRAAGRDARLMERLADERRLGAADCARLSPGAAAVVADWLAAGWVHPEGTT